MTDKKHSQQIKQALGIHGLVTTEAGWIHRPKRGERGAQIDLLLDRADNCITICEMKFSDSEFVITKAYADKLRNKLEVFRTRTGTRKTLFLVMVTTNGTKENRYYDELVDQQLTMNALFGVST